VSPIDFCPTSNRKPVDGLSTMLEAMLQEDYDMEPEAECFLNQRMPSEAPGVAKRIINAVSEHRS
jgi:hypothetical protein